VAAEGEETTVEVWEFHAPILFSNLDNINSSNSYSSTMKKGSKSPDDHNLREISKKI